MSKYITLMNAGAAEDGNQEEEDPSVYKRTLKKGMSGEDVTWVQNRLSELGYSLVISNLYDDATFSAVKAFQTQNGLEADGLAGQQTFAVLKSENARRADAQPLNYATLRIDDSGDGVRQLQTDLKALGYPVTVNGTYDTDTHNAVVAFQQRNGLVISGIADALTRQVIHGRQGKSYSTPVETLPANEGWMASPSVSQIKLLHWQNEIKPNVKAGQTFTVLDPNTNLSWKLVFYSLGRHADSQPASWKDTQIMNRSFGSTSWTIHPVYVLLPSGQWTMATMHNRPHLYGSITNNGFGGHLCVHFLRDMDEAKKNDPDYGVNNQVTLRSAWKALTGETVN
jgi:peptidoglycan hydrolase-like protein with peptidoglycan-binding domain